jgi:hypothetical protein
MENTVLLEALGATSEAEALKIALRLSAFEGLLLEATGCASFVSAIKQIDAWKRDSTKLVELQAEVESIKQSAQVDAEIARLSAEGKLPPAMHAGVRKYCKSPSDVLAFADTFKFSEAVGAPKVESAKSDVVTLSDEDAKVASLLGLSSDKMIEARREYGRTV